MRTKHSRLGLRTLASSVALAVVSGVSTVACTPGEEAPPLDTWSSGQVPAACAGAQGMDLPAADELESEVSQRALVVNEVPGKLGEHQSYFCDVLTALDTRITGQTAELVGVNAALAAGQGDKDALKADKKRLTGELTQKRNIFSSGKSALGATEVGRTVIQHSPYSGLVVMGVFNPAQGKVEYHQGRYSGLDVAGVYNPATQSVEWRDGRYSGLQVDGVYNPAKQQVEWRDGRYSGLDIAGVYNPATQSVEWRDGAYSGLDIDGVFNPATQQVEWRNGAYSNLAVDGVYNPATQQVEWSNGPYSEMAIAGVFNPASQKVEWHVGQYSGMSLVVSLWDGTGWQVSNGEAIPSDE